MNIADQHPSFTTIANRMDRSIAADAPVDIWHWDFELHENAADTTYYVYDEECREVAWCRRREDAKQIVDDHNARAKGKQTILDALESAEEYFDDRADAEYIDGRAHGNKEMHLLGEVRDAIAAARART